MMFDITFANQNELSNFGRGKDKVKRKSRVSVLAGAGLGTVVGGPVGGTIAGGLIAKGINKEKDRYDKQGPRSHLGKIGHDAKLGAKSVGLGSAITAGLAGAALGSQLPVKKKGFLGIGRNKEEERKQRLKNTLIGAGLGVLGGGTSGAISGGSNGALVGAARGFLQENKTKKKKSNFNQSTDNTSNYAAFLSNNKQRSKLGMVAHDTKKGAKIGAALGGAYVGSSGALGGLKHPGSIKSKVLGAATYGVLGTALGGIAGGIKGGAVGAGVGTGRALLTPRKKKSMLDRFKK